MLFTLKVIRPSENALSKIFETEATNFSRVIQSVSSKRRLQQLFVEDKPMKLLNDNLQEGLNRCDLQINEELKESVNNLMER